MRASLWMLCLTLSCTSAPAETEFVVSDADFAHYRDWPHLDLPPTANGSFHTSGPRRVYLNQRPPAGATSFPVGTILVKEILNGSGDTLAMVKRGGDYNADWARGWEWMEIVAENGAFHIEWRGFEPPPGASYSEQGVSCNLCHALARNNDWVQSAALHLPMQ